MSSEANIARGEATTRARGLFWGVHYAGATLFVNAIMLSPAHWGTGRHPAGLARSCFLTIEAREAKSRAPLGSSFDSSDRVDVSLVRSGPMALDATA